MSSMSIYKIWLSCGFIASAFESARYDYKMNQLNIKPINIIQTSFDSIVSGLMWPISLPFLFMMNRCVDKDCIDKDN